MPSFEEVGQLLLSEGLHLTALELHAELLESKGKELPLLRDFFSNPGNFEPKEDIPTSLLPRTSSMQTFDSLDLARGSDDGIDRFGESEKIAVLEYELRKANEEIRMLRANLTLTTTADAGGATGDREEGSTSQIIKNICSVQDLEGHDSDTLLSQCPDIEAPVKPHETRATNFLVNEFLMKNNCKLTAITFSDENADCDDLDNWDSVGLNIPKPPDLMHLYRFYLWALYSGRKNFSSGDNCLQEVLEERPQAVEAATQTEQASDSNRTFTDCEAQTNQCMPPDIQRRQSMQSMQPSNLYTSNSQGSRLPPSASDSSISGQISAQSFVIGSNVPHKPVTSSANQVVDDMKNRMRGLFSKK